MAAIPASSGGRQERLNSQAPPAVAITSRCCVRRVASQGLISYSCGVRLYHVAVQTLACLKVARQHFAVPKTAGGAPNMPPGVDTALDSCLDSSPRKAASTGVCRPPNLRPICAPQPARTSSSPQSAVHPAVRPSAPKTQSGLSPAARRNAPAKKAMEPSGTLLGQRCGDANRRG